MKNIVQGVYGLEFNFVDDNRVYLNFWDAIQGNDVCCQIIDDKIYKFVYSPKEIEDDEIEDEPKIEDYFKQEEISLTQFIKLIQETILYGFNSIPKINPQP